MCRIWQATIQRYNGLNCCCTFHLLPYTSQTMKNIFTLTSAQLHRAADLTEKISALQNELASILGSASIATPAPKRKSKMSAAARAKIAAAQKARWAKLK